MSYCIDLCTNSLCVLVETTELSGLFCRMNPCQIFFVTHKVNIGLLCDHEFQTINWSLVDSLVITQLKTLHAPLPESITATFQHVR